MNYRKVYARLLDVKATKSGRSALKWGKRLLVAGVLAVLVVQLSRMGWAEIWNDLPTTPLFYLIFLGMYLGLPVAETFLYRILWSFPFWRGFPVFLEKRVYNKDVLNYSGEARLYWWARKTLGRPGRTVLGDIKDNTIVSSLTSMLVALGLLSTFMLTDMLSLENLIGHLDRGWMIGGGVILVLLIALAITFRKSVITLPFRMIALLFGIHLARLLFVQTLQILQWMVVMPEVPIRAWLTLLSLQIVVNQLPLIPAKDLVVLGASAELSAWLDVSETGVVGMLLVSVVLDKVLNFALFAFLAWRGEPYALEPDPEASPGYVSP